MSLDSAAMRPFLLVGLAACWSNPPPKTPPTTPVVTAEVAAPAPPAPPRAYRLPAQIADALATEPLVGQVIVDDEAQLMATEAAARTQAGSRKNGTAMAARVVADHGDVVAIETARVTDCVESFKQPYELTVFVRRDQLVPRAKADVTKTFADGTAFAIDRGAPVSVTSSGLAWSGKAGAIAVPPAEDQLAYAVPAQASPAALPALKAERLVCDGGPPRTLAEWREERRAKRDAEARAKLEAQRIEREARQAEYERQRAEELRACRAKAAKKKKAKPNKNDMGRLLESDTCAMLELFGDSLGSSGMTLDSIASHSLYEEERFAPYCSVEKPWRDHAKAVPPKLDGKPMPWPDPSREVVRVGGKYFADVEYGCARARLAIDEPRELGRTGVGMMGGLQDQKVQVWIPRPGPVTWPDGSPAGRYSGRKRYRDVVEIDTRICVVVPGVAEQVCHDKATAKTDMVFARDLRD